MPLKRNLTYQLFGGLPWWLRIHLAMQWTPFRSLVGDATGQQTSTLQLLKPARVRVCTLQPEKPPRWEAHAPRLERSPCSLQLEQRRPSTAKNKPIDILKKKKLFGYLKVQFVKKKKENSWRLSFYLPVFRRMSGYSHILPKKVKFYSV